MRRILFAAAAALTFALASVSGDLRGGAVDDDDGSDVAPATDLLEALPPVCGLPFSPPPSRVAVVIDLLFPPSRMVSADVFRPPEARAL